jgi:hypothetical protein
VPVARRVLLVVSALVVLLLGGLVYITATISWERSITIEAGPEEGFFYQTGKELADDLQSSGSVATVTSRDDTLRIIGNVQDAQNPVNVGFIAQEVDPRNYPSVMSLGSIVLEPLLFLLGKTLATISLFWTLRAGRFGCRLKAVALTSWPLTYSIPMVSR